MSSPPGTPKRKGLRSLLPGSFSKSRSRSPSQSSQRPEPSVLSSSAGHNEGAGPTSRTTPATSPTDGPATGSHMAAPSAIPRIVEPADANTSQSRRRAAWTKLRISLQVLNDNSGVFPPLSSATGLLLTCLDRLEVTAGDREEYEDLSKELAGLSEFLHQRTQASGSYPISKSIVNISKSIEQQVQEINAKLTKPGGGGIRQATIDEEDILRHYRRIESLFRQLQADVTMSTWSIANEHLATTRLEGLKPVKQATYDSDLSTEIDRRTCTEGTRIGVLGDLKEWHHDSSSASVYWMNGMAGTGKTTIACTFCEQLEDRKQLAGSFFCTRSSAECRKVTRIVPTIAYQLARYSHPFKSALCEVLDQDPDVGTKNLTKQFEKLLKEPLVRVKGALPGDLVVVIDALDECDDRSGVEQVLDMLFRYAADVPLRFLVTSRPEPEIYQRMTQHAQSRVAIHLHDIEKSLVQADIKLYLEGELSSMSFSPPQIDELVNRSGALFIYAATLVRYIRSGERLGNSRKRLAIALGMTAESTKRHAQIDALYTAVLKSALSGEELEADEAEDVRAVLRTVLFAQEPISIDTIATLAEIDDPERVKSALQPLRSVLHQSEQTGLVSTLHASFPDFMFNNERSGSYFYDVVEHSQLMARRCFSVMKAQLQFNICNLSSSFVLDKDVADIKDRIRTHISASLVYTCRHWANHLQLAHSTECLLKILSEFLSDRFLFWMEVLNLKQEMNTGVEILVKAKHWLIQVDPSSELTYQIEDCRNFFTSYAANPISRSTPHIYISSLPLCPRSNSIYKYYWGRTRGLLELKGTLMESREGAALATWNMESAVPAVAYSPDGTQVAVGCASGSFSIRNTHDGSLLLGPFQIVGTMGNAADATLFVGPVFVSGSIASLSYSPDGTRIVTGSVDGTIRVWSTRNGEILTGPFRGDALDIRSVAFSPDGTRIVSGSPHDPIRFWNPDTGAPAIDRSPQNPEHTNCVAFSPDGRYIAFGLNDGSIHFIHASDGAPALTPLEGHTSEIVSLAFSPDGTRLVSSSRDHTIRIWNPSNGTLTTGPLKGHTSGVSSVAISRDGKYVASGSHDTTVRVWNIDDGSPFAGPFSGHRSTISSVAFSTDGTRLISGSDDGTIRVWNVSNGLLLPSPFGDHMSSIQTAIFSPDDQSIFSSSFQGIWIWSSDEGSLIANITRGRPHSRCFSTYSHDRTRHAIFLEDHSIQVLSTEDASTVAGPFKGHADTVTCASFSRDNTRLVSGSKDRTVRVWEVESGQLAAGPFYGHAGDIELVTFSFQGSKVVSYAKDKSIRVWNLVDCILDVDISSQANTSPLSSTIPRAFENWTTKEDGWVTNGDSSLLFWFPADLPSAPSPHTGLIITGNGALVIARQKLLVGDEWSRCYIP